MSDYYKLPRWAFIYMSASDAVHPIIRSPVCLRDIRIQPDVKSSWDSAAADILATTDDCTWPRTHKATNSRLIWRTTEIFVSFCVFAILGNKDGWLLKQCVPVPSRGGWRGHSRGSGGAIQSLASPHGGGAGRVAAGGRHPGLGGRQLPHQIRWLRMCRSLTKRKESWTTRSLWWVFNGKKIPNQCNGLESFPLQCNAASLHESMRPERTLKTTSLTSLVWES